MAWSNFLSFFPFPSDSNSPVNLSTSQEVSLTEPKTPLFVHGPDTVVWGDLYECADVRACMCKRGLFFSHCTRTKPRSCLLMWILFLWYFCVISLDQNNNELPGQKNKVHQRWTTTPVPRHSIVTSYGHVLKVENDEKQSNTPGPASEHCLEATSVLHSQQVN